MKDDGEALSVIAHRLAPTALMTATPPTPFPMILEVAILDVKLAQEAAFERDFAITSRYISNASGYVSQELPRCIEQPGRYILLARWETVEAHTEGFRKSHPYTEWKKLLHHYYDPFPTVQHYSPVPMHGVSELTDPKTDAS